MYVVLAWFSERTVARPEREAARARFESAVADVVPETYARHDAGGDDWGVTVLHPGTQGAYRWPMIATDGPLTAVSLGVPVGADLTGGPVALARALLGGADVHRDVVPPFGLFAVDGTERFAVQQDWLGMCRLFTGSADGITAFCSRPSALAAFLSEEVRPDLDGWASFAVSGSFGGDRSAFRGARLLQPGQRITGRRRTGGGWELTTDLRYCVDDVVLSGLAAQGRPVDATLRLAGQALTDTASSVRDLYDGPVQLGLSGGKDSRLIAASVVAAGWLPKLSTHDDVAAEGEIATELVRRLRDQRGLAPEHRLFKAGAPARVLTVGLRERTARLQRRYDFQFPSSYTTRPAVAVRLPNHVPAPNFSGAGGELVTGFWYASDDRTPEELALARLTAAGPRGVVSEPARATEIERITALLGRVQGLGVSDLHLVDYVYLVERVRRWYSSAYTIGLVTPFLSPGFVAATFALTPQQKRDRLLHSRLTAQLVPEWSGVPFVSGDTGTAATRVWEGDGVLAITDLLETAHGPIAQLISRDAVERALTSAVRQDHGSESLLRQFTYLAVASQQLEPDTVRPAISATYARVMAPPPPPPPAKPASTAPRRLRSRLTRVRKALRRRLPLPSGRRR